jgi:hypothetical protein
MLMNGPFIANFAMNGPFINLRGARAVTGYATRDWASSRYFSAASGSVSQPS